MRVKKYDRVKLNKRCDSLFLQVGDTGQVLSDELEDGVVAVAFDKPFEDAHTCDGFVPEGNGWFVKVTDLDVIQV